jgi:hypothetical protein
MMRKFMDSAGQSDFEPKIITVMIVRMAVVLSVGAGWVSLCPEGYQQGVFLRESGGRNRLKSDTKRVYVVAGINK